MANLRGVISFELVDGFADCPELIFDPLVLLIGRAERSPFRHNIVPNLWAHLMLPNIEVEQKLLRYQPCLIGILVGSLLYGNYYLFVLSFNKYWAATVSFFG